MKFKKKYERLSKLTKSKDPRFNSGICTICGEHMDVLLHLHSQLHGYKDAYEQIACGTYRVDFDFNFEGDV